MDGAMSHPRDKPRPPYPRSASRSSTGTSNSRHFSQSTNSSSSHINHSPKMQSAHPVHNYHHAACSRPSNSPRPASRQFIREGSADSARQTPVSSLLHERLQKERQAESQKLAASRISNHSSNSLDKSPINHRSPTKNASTVDSRPQSSAGDPSPKKGLALKEMEHVVSGLHKQNFDLKLELYHRRERQTMLEETVETLKSEKCEAEEANKKLAEEVEKREKAVEEAVAMIVTLEARIEELSRGGAQADAHGPYKPPSFDLAPQSSHGQHDISECRWTDEAEKTISRMPSFLSEKTENTENLRNVYLGTRGSLISLPRVSEGALDVPMDGLASPTLSVLSESSFTSVYGHKRHDEALSSKMDEPLALDGFDGVTGDSEDEQRGFQNNHTTYPTSDEQRGNTPARTAVGQFQPIASVMDGSPLQRIEKLDTLYAPRRQTPQSGNPRLLPPGELESDNLSRQIAKETKREALRRVITDAPGGVSLHDQGMPPTPDTISTATLHRMKTSNDTLAQGRLRGSRSDLQSSPENHAGTPIKQSPSAPKYSPSATLQKAPTFHPAGHPWGHQLPAIPRPRSADESTVSQMRERRWSLDSTESTDSLQSSLDIWLRAGNAKAERNQRRSPDMFGFPTGPITGSWAMDAMLGSAHGYSTTQNTGSNGLQMEELFGVHQALFGSTVMPAPPNRISSLQAQTALDGHQSAPSNERTQRPSGRRHRHTRRNSDDAQMRAIMKTPAQDQFTQPPPKQAGSGPQKRQPAQYPPISGQQTARNVSGLTRLWRRSFGGGTALSGSEAGTPTQAEFPIDSPQSSQQSSVPSFVSRSGVVEDDDRSGATPPPISRDLRHGQGPVSDVTGHRFPTLNGKGEVQPSAVTEGQGTTQFTMETQQTQQQVSHQSMAAGSATGARRKWLPAFGRTNNPKSRTS